MEQVGTIIKTNRFLKEDTVNSSKKPISTVNSIDTVNDEKTTFEKIEELLQKDKIQPEGIAKYLTELLNAPKNEAYYTILVKENPSAVLLEIAHYVKDMFQQRKIRTSMGVYFYHVLKRKGMKVRFTNDT